MHNRKIEERFEVAARYLCERWGCFDLVRHVQEGTPLLKNDSASEAEVEPKQTGRMRLRESELPRRLKSDIDQLGAVNAIKRRLRDESQDDISLDFAANTLWVV